ncbi:IS200/IS605 family transposase, partial [Salmonella enterica]|nr:IS200/IS605 family transposase [Salmonella enterica]EDQ1181316.1 IS200/IS605 family transposase [Salmonella enterica subsp. enterica serovar Norwich]EAW6175883.1 IS200/IS605 family transposase [Salmonella enterica]EBH5354813.1 IS200/IS605 family transposase [Salmonella enterica]EBM6034712.1 IS200/IS605 family transposase [Salmonella enterica]
TRHQLEEDKMGIPYPGSPFTGRK